jgi:hypothetical protein
MLVPADFWETWCTSACETTYIPYEVRYMLFTIRQSILLYLTDSVGNAIEN